MRSIYELHSEPESLLGFETVIYKDPGTAFLFSRVRPDLREKLEKAIATDALSSMWYAEQVLKGRFPAGEEAIAKSAYASFMYAKYALKGRFPAGEKEIKKQPSIFKMYKQDVLDVLN